MLAAVKHNVNGGVGGSGAALSVVLSPMASGSNTSSASKQIAQHTLAGTCIALKEPEKGKRETG